MLVIGACLNPRQSGMGTHQELGLPACGFLARTGWPCPSCGLTTSVSATMHGQFGLAFHAQPFGLLLTAVAAALAMAGTYQAATGRAALPSTRLALIAVMAGIVLLLASWGLKVYLGAASGEFPLH